MLGLPGHLLLLVHDKVVFSRMGGVRTVSPVSRSLRYVLGPSVCAGMAG